MTKRIGEVQEVQIVLPNGFIGEFVQVRVKLDVTNNLTRFVGFTKSGETEFYQVKFEKLPVFCYMCGLLATGVRNVAQGNTRKKIWSGVPSSLHQREDGVGVIETREEALAVVQIGMEVHLMVMKEMMLAAKEEGQVADVATARVILLHVMDIITMLNMG